MDISLKNILLICGIVIVVVGIALILYSRYIKELILHPGRNIDIHHSWGINFGITQITFPSPTLLKAKISFKDNVKRDIIFRIKETKDNLPNMVYEPIITKKEVKVANFAV